VIPDLGPLLGDEFIAHPMVEWTDGSAHEPPLATWRSLTRLRMAPAISPHALVRAVSAPFQHRFRLPA